MKYCDKTHFTELSNLLDEYGMRIELVDDNGDIPGSFWGDSEAGLVGNTLYVRPDTPIHSALHEACHYVCMDSDRRQDLHTDAGGGYAEENGVCYLQILLSDLLPDVGIEQAFADMDAWGYSFRLGSTRAWFYDDAEDAQQWLLNHRLIDSQNRPTWQLRK